MARKKSNRKPRPVLLPLGMKRADKIELPIRLALQALGTDWLTMDHVSEIFVHGDVIQKITEDPQTKRFGVMLMANALRVKERYERTGKVGVTGDELKLFKEILPASIEWLQEQPNHLIHRAVTGT